MNASARLIFCAHKHAASLTTSLVAYPLKSFRSPLKGLAPKYLIDLISVLPPSRYDLRRNNNRILLNTPKRFTKVWIDPLWRQRHGLSTIFLLSLDLLAPKVVLKRNFRHFFLSSKAFCLFHLVYI